MRNNNNNVELVATNDDELNNNNKKESTRRQKSRRKGKERDIFLLPPLEEKDLPTEVASSPSARGSAARATESGDQTQPPLPISGGIGRNPNQAATRSISPSPSMSSSSSSPLITTVGTKAAPSVVARGSKSVSGKSKLQGPSSPFRLNIKKQTKKTIQKAQQQRDEEIATLPSDNDNLAGVPSRGERATERQRAYNESMAIKGGHTTVTSHVRNNDGPDARSLLTNPVRPSDGRERGNHSAESLPSPSDRRRIFEESMATKVRPYHPPHRARDHYGNKTGLATSAEEEKREEEAPEESLTFFELLAEAPDPRSQASSSDINNRDYDYGLARSNSRETVATAVRPGAVAVWPGGTSMMIGRQDDATSISSATSFRDETITTNASTTGVDDSVAGPTTSTNTSDDQIHEQRQSRLISAHLVEEDNNDEEILRANDRIAHLEGRLRDLLTNHRAVPVEEQQELHATEVVMASAATTASGTSRRRSARRRQRGTFLMYCLAVLIPIVVVTAIAWAVTRIRELRQGRRGGTSNATTSEIADDTLKTTQTTASQEPTSQPSKTPAEILPCIEGGYYYPYKSGNGIKIGFVNVLTNASNVDVSIPDCSLYYLAFDSTGTAYGHCNMDGTLTLVTVDLPTGKTTVLTEFPRISLGGMAYNPVDDHLYMIIHNDDDTSSLAKIEKDLTLTSIGPPTSAVMTGFAIDSIGNAFSTDVANPLNLYSVDLQTGASFQLTAGQGFDFASASIAFDGQTLYGIEYFSSPMLFTVDISGTGTTATASALYNTKALKTYGGAFCPASSNPSHSASPSVSAPPSPSPSLSLQPTATMAPSHGSCVPNRFYYTYEGSGRLGDTIGSVDVTTNSSNQFVSNADCSLFNIAFDSTGTAYGHCHDSPRKLVTVDLQSGETTFIADFPRNTIGLVYNPVDDHFYTTTWDDQANIGSLVKIEKNWTFTPVHGSLLHDKFDGIAIDTDGNAFACDGNYPAKLYSVDMATGRSTLLVDDFRAHTLAFKGRTLYGIEYSRPATLFTVHVANGTNVTMTTIKDTEAVYSFGGAFCPL